MRAALIALLLLAGCETVPEMACAPSGKVAADLWAEFNERPAGVGLASKGGLMLLYAGPETWTLALAYPDGRSCLLESGRDWRAVVYREGSS